MLVGRKSVSAWNIHEFRLRDHLAGGSVEKARYVNRDVMGVYFLTAFMPENSNLYRLNEVAPRALIWVRAVHTRTLQALHTRNNYFN